MCLACYLIFEIIVTGPPLPSEVLKGDIIVQSIWDVFNSLKETSSITNKDRLLHKNDLWLSLPSSLYFQEVREIKSNPTPFKFENFSRKVLAKLACNPGLSLIYLLFPLCFSKEVLINKKSISKAILLKLISLLLINTAELHG